MSIAYVIVGFFIAALVFVAKKAEKAGRIKQCAFIVGALAVVVFSIPLVIAWQLPSEGNFVELAIAGVALCVLMPVVWKLFSLIRAQKQQREAANSN